MRSLTQVLSENGPKAKPEVWKTPVAALRRRMGVWFNDRLDPEWTNRPHIATIGERRLLLEVVPSDVVGKPITLFGVYELAVTSLLTTYLRSSDTFVDVGANLGYYTVLAADAVGAQGRVVSFEPSQRVRERLQRNIALNGFQNVEVRTEAATDRDGRASLVEPTGRNNDGLAYIDTSGAEGNDVPSIRLDGLFPHSPDLIKVDVEGREGLVFAGADGLLGRDDAPTIIFESFELDRDARALIHHGYRIFQPCLRDGRVALTADLKAPRYRQWEAPNFLATKSPRGHAFAQALLSA